MLVIVQHLFWLSVQHGFKLSACHIPGKLNIISDLISRMGTLSAANQLCNWFSDGSDSVECAGHMSYDTYCSLQEGWMTACLA
jgi:hypothetical protein